MANDPTLLLTMETSEPYRNRRLSLELTWGQAVFALGAVGEQRRQRSRWADDHRVIDGGGADMAESHCKELGEIEDALRSQMESWQSTPDGHFD